MGVCTLYMHFGLGHEFLLSVKMAGQKHLEKSSIPRPQFALLREIIHILCFCTCIFFISSNTCPFYMYVGSKDIYASIAIQRYQRCHYYPLSCDAIRYRRYTMYMLLCVYPLYDSLLIWCVPVCCPIDPKL